MLTGSERLSVIKIARDESEGKVPLLIQTGASSTARSIEKTVEAERLGADGALVITPYYCCPTQEGLTHHFEAIAQATDLPIILYNNPKRTGVGLEIETVVRLSKIKNIVGLKDASGGVAFVAGVLNRTEDFTLFSGDDLSALPMQSIGAKGVMSIMSNLMPGAVSELFRNPSLTSYHELLPLFQLTQVESNPIPIKAMMNILGMAAGECRLPLTPLSDQYLALITDHLAAYV